MLRLLALFLCAISTTYACSCALQHPQQSYCASDFVIRARVIAVNPNKKILTGDPLNGIFLTSRVYTLQVKKIYKGHQIVQNSSRYDRKTGTAKLYTPSIFSSCSVELQANKSYLVGGHMEKGLMSAATCSLIRDWKSMTLREKQNLLKRYHPNCQCKVKICHSAEENCEKINKKKTCGFLYSGRKSSCTVKHRYCRLISDSGACAWRKDSKYKECLKNTNPSN